MRAATAIRRLRWWKISVAVAIVLFLAIWTSTWTNWAAAQQPVRLIFGGPAPQAELTAPQVDAVSSTIGSRLEQARALAAARNWNEAVDIYSELASEHTDRVVALGDTRYVSLPTYCQLQLARLPAEALVAYRRRVEAQAERWYREGLAARDSQMLARVVDELFCSSWGDDALLALGELALEQGDFASARRDWEQISPLLRDPDGGSVWQALRGVDVKTNWAEIDRRWHSRRQPPDWLAYPDSSLDLADVRARLILASIRAGQFERAALELEVFRRLHPNAAGQFGGQQGPYVAALEKLLASAREWKTEPPSSEWPTFAGAQSRSPAAMPVGQTLMPAWERAIAIVPPPFARRLALFAQGAPNNDAQKDSSPPISARESGRPLSSFPVVADGLVMFCDAAGVHAANLATGKPTVTTDSVVYRNDSTVDKPKQPADIRVISGIGVSSGVPRLTLNVFDHIAYGRVGSLATSRSDTRAGPWDDQIVALDLRREGLLALRIRPEDAAWSFDGAPVSDGRRLFVAMRRSGASPHAYVACFDVASSGQLWRTSTGSADTPAGGLGDEITHNLLTLAGDRIYFNTNLGLIAALNADNGAICWLAKYPRLTGKPFTPGNSAPLYFDRDPSPCLYHDGLVVVAPADTPAIFALDAETGKTVWANDQLADGLQLLGVVNQKLIVSGNRLASLDIDTGKIQWIWPESDSAGIRGMGRGVVAGSEIFWPTRTEIYAIDPETGARTRSPISLSPVSDCGANLAAADGYLIVAGYDKLLAFGPPVPTAPPIPKQSKISPVTPRTGRLSDQSNVGR